ncbi:MAG: penicillin acylase family protein [Alphaproteobacteria bacterium]|nr:penicillin acylase family protein [Alphaproteobacteria bacterium]
MTALLLLLACAPKDPITTLDGPVEVRFDDLGVAHIQATTEDDLFFAQGYVTARDRLYHMDLLRRRACGRRAEILGEDFFAGDAQMRALDLWRWGQRAAEEMAVSDPALHDLLRAYAAGVNQYIQDATEGVNGQSLSPHFEALGYTPEPWRVADSLALGKLLTAGSSLRAEQEILTGLAQTLMSDAAFADLYRYAPLDPGYVVPGFYDSAASGPPASGDGRARLREALGEVPPGTLADAARALARSGKPVGGSNNFAVAASASASGHALLAGDTHQEVDHPAIWYLIHLDTLSAGGDIDAIGASLPGVPFVLFGHNDRVAWAPTVNFYDVADVYMEIPSGRHAVMFEGEEVALVEREETIYVRAPGGSVADAEPRSLTVREVPHHGPILPEEALDLPLPLTLSVRWTGYQPRSVARSFYEINKSGDYDAFRAAVDHYYTGGMHWLYADIEGRIGYTSYTEVPLREQVDPTAPPIGLLPGDGGYEWLPGDTAPYAMLEREQLPWTVDPAAGFLVSANNDPAGLTDDNDPYNDPVYLAGLFAIGARAYRPEVMLEGFIADGGVTLDQLIEVQQDTTSQLAVHLLPFLSEAAARRPDLVTDDMAQALEILEVWDRRCDVDAVGPTLFHAWLSALSRLALADEGGGLIGELILPELPYPVAQITSKTLVHWLEATAEDIDAFEAGELPWPTQTGRSLFDDPDTEAFETRDEVLLASLALAVEELDARYAALGASDMDGWTWGLSHTLSLDDAAEAWLPGASSETLPKAGGLYTVDVGNFTLIRDGALPEDFDIVDSPSNRFVFELDPDGIIGKGILPGGQSERPGDPHHIDQFERYTRGEYGVLRYDPDDIEASEEAKWTFEAGWPAKGGWSVE